MKKISPVRFIPRLSTLIGAGSGKREARSGKREAGSEERGAGSEEREARSGKQESGRTANGRE